MEDYVKEQRQKLIRDTLNEEKIKLWLPPYTDESGNKGEVPHDLVNRYAKKLELAEQEVAELLELLRQHALQKLSEREKFKNEGIATVRVRLTGSRPYSEGSRKKTLILEINLISLGSDLKRMLSEKADVPCEQLKLISSGHVIKDDVSLEQQNVKNGSQVMAIRLTMTEVETQRQQEHVSNVAKTRQAAELLTSKMDTEEEEHFDIQIADQSGKPLQLPLEEKKALTLAMTLHEKGRAALKKKEVSQALLLFLEADGEFSKCKAELLNAVDNYAVLCLDIVWCYLCLKNVEQLPDAEWRLQQSENCFLRSYGANNERLMAVKGGTGNEQAQALFMKLHLLQGIVAFHQHKTREAARLLKQAEEELKNLHVDENLITEVMTMGFRERESRLALRACKGDVTRAVEHIVNRRKEKKEINTKVNEERKQKKRAKKYGKTANGEWVNTHNLDMLVGMGFSAGAAAEALKQGNNDVSLALEVLQTHPELLSLPDTGDDDDDVEISDDMLAQLTGLGFEMEMGRRALLKHHGNIQRAVEDLMNSGGFIPPQDKPSTSAGKSPEEKEREYKALDNLVSDISRDEEDYLDLTLKEELEIMQEYKALLESLAS